jgi:hypothetical protein
MFKTLRIKLFGKEPVAEVDSKTLERIICRDFGTRADEVKQKLQKLICDTSEGRNRISAAIIKLAENDIDAIDNFIEISNNDFRDVLARAEYPRCFELGFGGVEEDKKKQIYLADWTEYSNWLNKK